MGMHLLMVTQHTLQLVHAFELIQALERLATTKKHLRTLAFEIPLPAPKKRVIIPPLSLC